MSTWGMALLCDQQNTKCVQSVDFVDQGVAYMAANSVWCGYVLGYHMRVECVRALGCNARSSTLESNYLAHRETLDVAGAVISGEEMVVMDDRNRAYLQR